MCTALLLRDDQRVVLTMNRDELVARPPEAPPRIRRDAACSILSPVDSQSDGTWAAANRGGVVAWLLNRYEEATHQSPHEGPSRGGIVEAILSNGGFRECFRWIEQSFDPRPYAPFTLAMSAPRFPAFKWRWSGSGKLCCESLPGGWSMITSSSWESRTVVSWREEKFKEWKEQGASLVGRLPGFNLMTLPGLERTTPMMRRTESRTRSLTQLRVDLHANEMTLDYWTVPPLPRVDLPRRRIRLPLATKST